MIIDCGSSPSLAISGVTSYSNEAYYTYASTQPNINYAGMLFQVSGCTNPANNGIFACVTSSTTNLVLRNLKSVTETGSSATAQTAGAVYYDHQPSGGGGCTLLFAKQPGAGQTHFSAVAGILYAGDGVDTWMYTPGVGATQPNGNTGSFGIEDVWHWSGAAPATQPSVSTVQTGAGASVWSANTVYSTMGLLLDSNGHAQLLIGVNSSGTNATQFGTSGQGAPAWADPSTTSDNTITWSSQGVIGLWQPKTVYSEWQPIFDPNTGWIFQASGGTTTTTPPVLTATPNSHQSDPGGFNWQAIGPAVMWQPSTTYGPWWKVPNCLVCQPVLPTKANLSPPTNPLISNPTIYLETCNDTTNGDGSPGTSGSGYTPKWPDLAGQPSVDGDLQWIDLGSTVWTSGATVTAWTQGSQSFSVVVDPYGDFQVCIQNGACGATTPYSQWQASISYPNNSIIAVNRGSGTFVLFKNQTGSTHISGSTEPAWNISAGATTTDNGWNWTCESPLATVTNVWGNSYGAQTSDGTAVWVNVGPTISWVKNTQWYYPKIGFSPPTSSEAYGGAIVLGGGNVQVCVATGKSGGSTPSWASFAIGSTHTDGGVSWYTEAVYTTHSLSWSYGYCYAYSFYSRLANDGYNTSIAAGGFGPPPGIASVLGIPTGSQTGNMTTASPINQIIGSNSGSVNTLTGLMPTDPQFDTVIIWRSPDMVSGSANMLFLTEFIPAPSANGKWKFEDYLPDIAETGVDGVIYPGLNVLIPAPIDDQNDPAPANFLPQVYNMERIWGISGNEIMFSGGPDVISGNPNSAFSPDDEFTYLQNPVRAVKTSQGLAVFLPGSIEFIAGGPLTASFYPVTIAPGIGLGNYNALDQHGGEITFLAVDKRLMVLTSSLDVAEVGYAIADRIVATIFPNLAYLAELEVAQDQSFYLADGQTGWYRCWPRTPQLTANGISWSPFAEITNGCKMVRTAEITPGLKKLLVGPNGSGQILMRNLTTFTDNGTEYDAWFTVGALMLAHPGQTALCKFLEFDFAPEEVEPEVSYLMDEISGNFTSFIAEPEFDPPARYGATLSPASYSPLRFYFAGTGQMARCRHLQVTVDFGTDSNPDEMINMTVYGRQQIEA
jgi:hypothetical protein